MVHRLLILFLFPVLLQAQPSFGPRSPLNIPLQLAGTFGELRGNHYHSGIDLKTGGKNGLPVLAAAHGFICRIKVSATGFGNALYLHHPEGFTTVYAHLHAFEKNVTELVDSLQKASELYEIDFQPDSTLFPVRAGDRIGLSGNSGGSEGPHLHFEIRDRHSEEPLNPLLFGLPVSDTTEPEIIRVIPYFLENNRWIRFPDELKGDTIYSGYDTLGIGIYSIDPDSNSRLGIYQAKLISGKSVLFQYRMDRFSFNETRMINAHVDYSWWHTRRQRIHRLYKLPNDQFSVFRNAGPGYLVLQDSLIHALEIVVNDFKGNTTDRKIFIKKTGRDTSTTVNTDLIRVAWDTAFRYSFNHLKVSTDPGTFYQDELLHPLTVKRPSRSIYQGNPQGFNNPETALHKAMRYQFKRSGKLRNIPPEKLVMFETDSLGRVLNAGQASLRHDSVEYSIRKAGLFAPGADTESPYLYGYRFVIDSITGGTLLYIKVKDEISGIGQLRVLQNNQWIPAFYEIRTGEVVAKLNALRPSMINITVKDACNNSINLITGY